MDWALPKSTVNTVMMELKKNGYIELEPIKGKRREMTVILTHSGKEYADSLLAPIYEKEAEVFTTLTAEERNVIEHLRKISELLKKTRKGE